MLDGYIAALDGMQTYYPDEASALAAVMTTFNALQSNLSLSKGTTANHDLTTTPQSRGRMGGLKAAQTVSHERRVAIGRAGALKRWNK